MSLSCPDWHPINIPADDAGNPVSTHVACQTLLSVLLYSVGVQQPCHAHQSIHSISVCLVQSSRTAWTPFNVSQSHLSQLPVRLLALSWSPGHEHTFQCLQKCTADADAFQAVVEHASQ